MINSSPTPSQASVLIVEDDHDSREIVELYLRKLCSIDDASTTIEGFEKDTGQNL